MNLPLIQSDNQELMLMQTRWKSILDAVIGGDSVAALETGTLIPFAGGDIPDGYLLCDGREVPKLTYPELAAVLGTTWGTPANSTNVKLPDARGRTLIGAGTGSGLTARTLGSTGGEESHTLTTPEMPAHDHGLIVRNEDADTDLFVSTSVARRTGGASNMGHTLGGSARPELISDTGGGGAHNNMQPWAAVNWIIKA